jgi:hypothetical protein
LAVWQTTRGTGHVGRGTNFSKERVTDRGHRKESVIRTLKPIQKANVRRNEDRTGGATVPSVKSPTGVLAVKTTGKMKFTGKRK